jgi:hypothetical protein
VYAEHRRLQRRELRTARHGRERIDHFAPIDAEQQLAFHQRRRVTEPHPHQKPIELRFRQRERAHLILRILRGDHEERLGQRHRLPIERDLMLFHGLEQRALRLRRGAIDFVGQHQLRENRTALKAELTRVAIVHRHTEHVGRQQIAGELHALERQSQGFRESVSERRLADARNVLDQQMAARQQAGETEADLRILAEDDPVELGKHRLDDRGGLIHRARSSALTRAICRSS